VIFAIAMLAIAFLCFFGKAFFIKERF
jgi:hypothetical protein